MSGIPRIRRFQFGIKHLLLATAVIALLLGIWMGYIRKAVVVRKAAPSDRIYERYFGFSNEDVKARNILVATGTFTKSTWLTGSLYLVQNGVITPINGWTVGRSSNQIGSSIWERMAITIALGDEDSSNGHETCLGCAGQTRGSGQSGGLPNSVTANSSLVVPCTISTSGPHIVYAEGERDPIIDQDMSLEEFARKNTGSYLVVTLQLD
jgi:hypothetical protein